MRMTSKCEKSYMEDMYSHTADSYCGSHALHSVIWYVGSEKYTVFFRAITN